MQNNCSDLYILSTVACQLAECLDKQELETLSVDLTILGYMLDSLLTHQPACNDDEEIPPVKLLAKQIFNDEIPVSLQN